MTMDEFKEWRGNWKDREIISCGFLAHYSEGGLVLIKSRDMKDGEDQTISQCLEIPRGMVRSVKVLKETRRK